MKTILHALILFSCFPIFIMGQDIHTSHLHSSPLIINPATTGLVEGTGRVIAGYRQQWKEVTANYRTAIFSIDADLFDLDRKSSFGAGLQVIQDQAGDLDYKTTSYIASLSMIRSLDPKHENVVSVGVQYGRVQNSFAPENIIAFDEEPNLVTAQNSYNDVSVGLLWLRNLSDHQFLYGGLAAYHVNNPVYTFFDPENDQNRLYRRYVAHGGASLNFNGRLKFMPNVIYMKQGPYQQLNLGTFFSYRFDTKKSSSTTLPIMPGLWMRSLRLEDQFSVDAVVIAVRASHNKFNFTFSYDLNVSSLARASTGRGGPEFSMIYQIGELKDNGEIKPYELPWKKKKKFDCPVWWW